MIDPVLNELHILNESMDELDQQVLLLQLSSNLSSEFGSHDRLLLVRQASHTIGSHIIGQLPVLLAIVVYAILLAFATGITEKISDLSRHSEEQENRKKDKAQAEAVGSSRVAVITSIALCIFMAPFALTVTSVWGIILLPFHCMCPSMAASMKHFGAPLFGFIALPALMVIDALGNQMYGAWLCATGINTMEAFLNNLSASKRKLFRRNIKDGKRNMDQSAYTLTYAASGEWQFSSEHVALLWQHYHRQTAVFAWCPEVGYISSFVSALVFMLVLPSNLFEVRHSSGRLVAFGSDARIGQMMVNPTYACDDKAARMHLYAVVNEAMIQCSLDDQAGLFNALASGSLGKCNIGLVPLRLTYSLVWQCTWFPRCCSRVKHDRKSKDVQSK